MFGYPTGIGALVARRASLAELRRPWFAGGTVDFVSVQSGVHALREGSEGFEDGTANFLAIGAIPAGLAFLEQVGVEQMERRATWLALRLIRELARLRHGNGAPVAQVYGPTTGECRGATVAFNVLDPAGVAIPYQVVEARTREARVSVRGGCFCNPGTAEAAFRFAIGRAEECLRKTHATGWSIPRFAECMQGSAVGAVRASFGAPSNGDDLERLLSVIATFSVAE
jgi:selenocysteine lyase/cysteine desulfurase